MKRKSADWKHECTSWVVMPDLTGGKMVLLHKNRDSDSRRNCLRHGDAVKGKKAWIAVGDFGSGVNIGINSSGVAILMNSGEPTDGFKEKKSGLSTPAIAQRIMEKCSSAAESLSMLEQIVREKKYYHGKKGSIWFISDVHETYLAEHDAVRFAARSVKSGFEIRANAWHFPEMNFYTQRTPAELIAHYRRETAVRSSLFGEGTRYKELVTVEKISAASRINVFPEDPECYPLCGKRTVCAATVEIDCEYPEFLSSIYCAFGPPRYTAYLPVPLLLDTTKIPDELAKVTFCEAVFARREKAVELLPQDELVKFERKMNKRHSDAVEAARKKLKAGGTKADAAKLLTAAFLRNWEALRKLSAGK